ncbi:MAG: N-acetylmuramoyl-L-alanine amidase, partial [Myxococcales bacterium]|nr:N-acetylmuramoyl-L-alanine amidase [Myxococcales bacterium]
MRVLVRLTVFAMLAAHLGACGERDVDPSGPYESDLDALRSAYSRSVASSVTATSGVQRIRRELRAAELASWLSLRQPREPWWVRARGHLLTAFQETDPLACEAGVALASHEASRPDYLRDALVTAETVLERFEGRGSAECLEGARRVVGILSPSVEREATKGSPGEARVADFRAWTTSPAKQESGARLVDVHVYGHDEDTSGQTARIVLRLDGVVPFEHGETPSTPVARRTLKVSLPGATLGQAFAPVKVAQGGAGTLRTTGGAAGVEVSIDLDDDTAYQLFFLADPYRLVLDLEKPDGGEVASRLRILVLDPGHGGDDYGARYGGLKEAKVALDITRRVGGIL